MRRLHTLLLILMSLVNGEDIAISNVQDLNLLGGILVRRVSEDSGSPRRPASPSPPSPRWPRSISSPRRSLSPPLLSVSAATDRSATAPGRQSTSSESSAKGQKIGSMNKSTQTSPRERMSIEHGDFATSKRKSRDSASDGSNMDLNLESRGRRGARGRSPVTNKRRRLDFEGTNPVSQTRMGDTSGRSRQPLSQPSTFLQRFGPMPPPINAHLPSLDNIFQAAMQQAQGHHGQPSQQAVPSHTIGHDELRNAQTPASNPSLHRHLHLPPPLFPPPLFLQNLPAPPFPPHIPPHLPQSLPWNLPLPPPPPQTRSRSRSQSPPSQPANAETQGSAPSLARAVRYPSPPLSTIQEGAQEGAIERLSLARSGSAKSPSPDR